MHRETDMPSDQRDMARGNRGLEKRTSKDAQRHNTVSN